MKNIFNSLIVFLILLVAQEITFAGGGNRTGTGGAAQLLIPVGPRGIAMGESGVATASGIEALFWNPAGVSKLSGSTAVMFSHMSYIADIGIEYGAISTNFEGFGVLSLSIRSLGVGDIKITTTQDPEGTGSTFKPQLLTAGISFARQLTERISVGLTTNIISESYGEVSATGVGFNIGLIYDNLADINGLSFGIVMKNLGPQMKFDGSGLLVSGDVAAYNRPPGFYKIDSAPFDLPSTFEIGVGFKPVQDAVNSLQLSGLFQSQNFSGDEYKLGAEYGYQETFFARLGYQTSPQVNDENYIYGLTAGVGINYHMEGVTLKVDYAYRDVEYFNANHVFSISLGF